MRKMLHILKKNKTVIISLLIDKCKMIHAVCSFHPYTEKPGYLGELRGLAVWHEAKYVCHHPAVFPCFITRLSFLSTINLSKSIRM